MVVDIDDGCLRAGYASVKQEMAAVAGVVNVSVSNNVPGDWKNIPQVEIASTGEDARTRAHFFAVDEHFLETYRMKLAEGRSF